MTDALDPALREHLARREDALARVRDVLVNNLKVALPPEQIELDVPLFGTGLGLDSVDAVELVVAIEQEFDLRLAEDGVGPWALRTVHSLVELVIDPPTEADARAEVPLPALPPEQAALRAAVAIHRADATHVLRLRGDGARETALHVLPSRLHLRDAQARPSLFLDERGHPIADVLVCADDEDLLLLVDGPVDARAHVQAHAKGEVTIEDLSDAYAVIEVHGPWAWELVAAVLGDDFLALPYLDLFHVDDGWCVRAGRTGEFGYHLVQERGAADRVHARLLDAGAAFDALEIDAEALSLATFESGFFDPAHVPEGATPIELHLGWRLATDRDYLGRAAVEARRAEDPPRITWLCAATELAAGDPVHLGDRAIGGITRAAYSPAREEWIAAALLPRALAHGGIDRLRVRGRPARTVAPPLIDNRSLYVDPRRHAYVTRDEVRFGALPRVGSAAMKEPA